MDVMREAFPVTFKLAIMALVFEAIFGITVGLVAGLRQGGIFDATALLTSLFVIAVPTFVIGFVLQFVIGVRLGWLPATAGSNPDLGASSCRPLCSERCRSPTCFA